MTQSARSGTSDRDQATPGRLATDIFGQKSAPAVKAKRWTAANDANSTRERILDVAIELFLADGYDRTTLRRIAETLDVTKAALYYHFKSKEDILLALHMRLHEFDKGALDAEGDEPMTLEVWGQLLDRMVDQMLAQRNLFLMHQRNQAALEKLHNRGHESTTDDIQNRFRTILLDRRVPVRDRVRMASAFGAAFVGLAVIGESFSDSDTKEIGRHAP